MRGTITGVAASFLFLSGCASAQTGSVPNATAPTLIVFITVDQLRADYLERFGAQLDGGLARLTRGGAVFTNGFHDHGITETAPGHASTMSGRFPRSTGIVENTRGVEDPRSPMIGGAGLGASPARFRGTTLTDWLVAANPATRVLSVSRKDRGAILPIGRSRQNVFWYGADGNFTTSSYYADTLPTWLTRFNARRIPATMAGRAWTPLLAESAYPEVDSVAEEAGGGQVSVVFPHVMPADTALAIRVLPNYPWMDELTLNLALEGVTAMQLGNGPRTDLLAVSLSTTDAVGHRYGPDSREVHDQIVRLDRYLGAFMDSLYKLRDSTRVVFALTADHGVAPYIGVKSRDPNGNGRYAMVWDTVALVEAKLRAAGVDSTAFRFDPPYLQLDRRALERRKIKPDSLVRSFAAAMRKVPGVMRAETLAEIARRDTTTDAIARRWLHMFPPDLPIDLVVTLEPYSYWSRGIATHGTPHDYDAHVPLIFYGAPFKPGRYPAFVRVVDMAPTIARVAGVKPLERLDGHVLDAALR